LDLKSRTRLEKRLQIEENLKQELETLKRTRFFLRSQPRLRASRNFTLTPQMAGMSSQVRHSLGAYPALRLASILATIFLVLVIAGDLIGSSMKPATMVASDLSQQAPAVLPGWGLGGSGSGNDGSPAEELFAEEAALQTEAPAMKAMPAEDAPETALRAAPRSAAEEESAFEPPEEAGEALDDSSIQLIEIAEPRQVSWPVIRVLQLLLAALALGTGVGAVWLRRASRI
jgi:hypothetical protein